MCNVGSAVAGTTSASYGSMFQWWRNVPILSTGSVPTVAWPLTLAAANATSSFITHAGGTYDWLTPQDSNQWWGASTNENAGTYSSATSTDQSLMQWPCASGYHVPTSREWCDVIDAISGNGGCASGVSGHVSVNSAKNNLMIPYGGFRGEDGVWSIQEAYGYYWTSSPMYSTVGRYVGFETTFLYPIQPFQRVVALSVRCMKN